jgi:hypothetical protein
MADKKETKSYKIVRDGKEIAEFNCGDGECSFKASEEGKKLFKDCCNCKGCC